MSTKLVKVDSIDTIKNIVNVTQLDIDNYGSVIPLKGRAVLPVIR
jgi:hypothetical protein